MYLPRQGNCTRGGGVNDTIGNRTCHFPACSTVPEPTAPKHTPYRIRNKSHYASTSHNIVRIVKSSKFCGMRCLLGWEGKTAYKILVRKPLREIKLAKTRRRQGLKIKVDVLILSFRRVLYVVCFLLGIYPTSEV